MAITITQTPHSPFDMAYGANPITLSNISNNADKYALRIYVVGQTEPIADIRQTPNRVGRAIFDIQNILQSQVGPMVNNIDSLHYSPTFAAQNTRLALAGPSLVEYQIATAEETGGIVGTFTTDPRVFTAIAGSKQYFQVPMDTDPYQVDASGDDSANPCTFIDRYAMALSDNQYTIADDITGLYFSSPSGVDVHNVYRNDQCTKTFYSLVDRTGGLPAPLEVRGIEGFWVLQYDGTSQNASVVSFVPNIQANGGGPNVALAQGNQVSGVFQTITIATGPANSVITIQPATKYYYILPVLYGCPEDGQQQIAVMNTAAWRAQKYIINEEPCNDFPHVQFAWQNSFGYRDQFTFTKRVNHMTKTQNNNYLKGAADYNSTGYDVDIQDRGYTTFSQKIQNEFEVTSGYMSDKEAELLKHLYQSAEVKVRFSQGPYQNQWVPVIINSLAYTEKTNRKDNLFQYTVKFTLASNQKAMRG